MKFHEYSAWRTWSAEKRKGNLMPNNVHCWRLLSMDQGIVGEHEFAFWYIDRSEQDRESAVWSTSFALGWRGGSYSNGQLDTVIRKHRVKWPTIQLHRSWNESYLLHKLSRFIISRIFPKVEKSDVTNTFTNDIPEQYRYYDFWHFVISNCRQIINDWLNHMFSGRYCSRPSPVGLGRYIWHPLVKEPVTF